MRLFTLSIIMLLGLSLSAQSNCDSLYNQYNPEYLSYKTTSLIMRQILDNCVEKDIQAGRVEINTDVRPDKLGSFVPSYKGPSTMVVDRSNTLDSVSTFSEMLTSFPNWFVIDPLAPANESIKIGRVAETIVDQGTNDFGPIQAPTTRFRVYTQRRTRRNKNVETLSKRNYQSSNKNNTIDEYSRITQSTADSILSERIILMSADFADCLYNSNSDVFLNNDTSLCFQHTVMTPITGEAMDDSLVVERRDFINDLSVDRIRNILISSEIDEQDFELIYRDSLDQKTKNDLDSVLNNLILVTYINKQQELPNIYKSYNELVDTLLSYADDLLSILNKEKLGLDEFTTHTKSLDTLNIDLISKNRELLERS